MIGGPQLAREIDGARVAPGECAVWWLGQHSFVLKLGATVVCLDPFLSPLPGRQVPPLLAPADLAGAALVCGSHDHIDHIDRDVWPAIAAAAPACRFVVPELLRERLAADLRMPQARFLGLDDGTAAECAGVRISGVAAAHEFLDRDPATGRYPYLGYVLEGNGCTLYHSGDTCVYEGLQTKLRRWRFAAAFLPINGRDARRLRAGCIGNMTWQEAADLAGALAPGLTVPAHFDMFAMNSADPALFADYMAVKYPHLRVHVPRHADVFRCGPARL
jgi:L-ascorbate metabolism protein UlaG (beta-lactamase superfamily)